MSDQPFQELTIATWDQDGEDDSLVVKTPVLTPRQILEQALENLAPSNVESEVHLKGWVKESWVTSVVDADHQFREAACSVGAMLLTTRLLQDDGIRNRLDDDGELVVEYARIDPNFDRALRLLFEQIFARRYPPGVGTNMLVDKIVSWNDDEDRTDSEVYDVFTQAIKRAIEEEADES